ncbi:hypothetical protein GCM10010329_13940 [Streptomyces spiroverticillatus]|uniref:DUF1996 domain-containing protein n=1 Tax=Streptomyces finlayi TaxID=67296 RepID=A0A918X3E7_9ACTN|nr:DUF1996 domain-containing protein [Streptomyces finlayi]GGZ93989.1 hypothetical protein GCM10010329_13940 [Streptomyces spiroverticillatus]GHD06468.1 hypothetical protein GCM10010334_57980 [Streptomyces finlayi]
MGKTERTTSRPKQHKRSPLAKRAIAASAALVLGGGGLIALNVHASATEEPSALPSAAGPRTGTINCPDVSNALPDVPQGARQEVDRELAAMDSRLTEAYAKFAEAGSGADQDAVLGSLKEQRAASLTRIADAVERQAEADRPQGLEGLAGCTMQGTKDTEGSKGSEDAEGSGSENSPQESAPDGTRQGNAPDGTAPRQGNGPDRSDFVDIRSVRPNAPQVRNRRGASKGTFSTFCGRNENGKFNPDNVIVAPGVSNGAHHMHDYVGNQATDAFASDDILASGRTTCRNPGDRSTYYWPVLRLQNGKAEDDANADGGGKDQNTGEIQTPRQVTLDFVGNPTGKVTAMPRFLRIITGDAKAFTNGTTNANASWSCTGFENRQLKDKYPICPRGSQVVRTFRFQSCWDGRNADSANHRTHVAFARQDGSCALGFQPIPQLVQRVVYAVPKGPGFAVDSFPEQLHKPVTDHGDFINVFDEGVMGRMVRCINTGQRCR